MNLRFENHLPKRFIAKRYFISLINRLHAKTINFLVQLGLLIDVIIKPTSTLDLLAMSGRLTSSRAKFSNEL